MTFDLEISNDTIAFRFPHPPNNITYGFPPSSPRCSLVQHNTKSAFFNTMDKALPVLAGLATSLAWAARTLVTVAYYVTIPLHYPLYYLLYYLLRLLALVLSPLSYILTGVASAAGVVVALFAKLKVSWISHCSNPALSGLFADLDMFCFVCSCSISTST